MSPGLNLGWQRPSTRCILLGRLGLLVLVLSALGPRERITEFNTNSWQPRVHSTYCGITYEVHALGSGYIEQNGAVADKMRAVFKRGVLREFSGYSHTDGGRWILLERANHGTTTVRPDYERVEKSNNGASSYVEMAGGLTTMCLAGFYGSCSMPFSCGQLDAAAGQRLAANTSDVYRRHADPDEANSYLAFVYRYIVAQAGPDAEGRLLGDANRQLSAKDIPDLAAFDKSLATSDPMADLFWFE